MKLSESVRRARKARRWTQQELAVQAGCDARTVRRVESGDYDDGESRATPEIARALGIDMAWQAPNGALVVVQVKADPPSPRSSQRAEEDEKMTTNDAAQSAQPSPTDDQLSIKLNVPKEQRSVAHALAQTMEIEHPDPDDDYDVEVADIVDGRTLYAQIVGAEVVQVEADDADLPEHYEAMLLLLDYVEEAQKWSTKNLRQRYELQVSTNREIKTLKAANWDILAARLNRRFTDYEGIGPVRKHIFRVKLRISAENVIPV